VFYEEVKNGFVELYDIHRECNKTEGCPFRRNKDEFSGCSGIGGSPQRCYCLFRPDHPRVGLNWAFVRCGE
jgi:hypothetical protein